MKFPAADQERGKATLCKIKDMESLPAVGLVGDDSGFIRELERTLEGHRFAVTVYSSVKAFLEEYPSADLSCVVMDLSQAAMTELFFRGRLPNSDGLPAILISSPVDTPASRRVVKSVAIHFFAEPGAITKLLSALQLAISESAIHAQSQELASMRERFTGLSPREREILLHVIAGKLNKQIASDLGISEQTVKIHRMRITKKSGLLSVAALARAACLLGYQPAA